MRQGEGKAQAPPTLGQHTAEVLSDWRGWAREQVDRSAAGGALGENGAFAQGVQG